MAQSVGIVTPLEGNRLQMPDGRILDPVNNTDDRAIIQASANIALYSNGPATGDPNAVALNAYLRGLPPAQLTALQGGSQGQGLDFTGLDPQTAPQAGLSTDPGQRWAERQGAYATFGTGGDTESTIFKNSLDQQLEILKGGVDANRRAVGEIGQVNNNVGAANTLSLDAILKQIASQSGSDTAFVNQSRDLATQLGGARDTANAQTRQNLGAYQSGLSGLSAYNSGLVGGLSDLYGSMSAPLQSSLVANALTSQAAQAYADPASIAAQNQALGFLGGAMNGSLDYASQAAQAYANAQDVFNQQMSADELQAAAYGSKDVDFWNLPGIKDLEAAYGGSQDVHVGQEDPEAYAAMQSALRQYSNLTTPEVTAAERFIYEQARLRQEQDERSARAATLTDQRQRGLSGIGAEIGQAALAGQQTSQNRLLSDLGAQANAIERSMGALQGYGNLSSTMSAQANDIAKQNASNRLNALDQFTDIGSTVETGNKNRQLEAQEAAQQAYATLRAQGFDEEYARGVAADTAAAHNQATRLQGGISYGSLATDMRNASFDESFKRGTAADQTNQFNENNRVDVQKYNQNYAANERDKLWGRGADLTTAGLKASDLNATNLGASYVAGDKATGDIYNRDKDVFGAQDLTNVREHDASEANTKRVTEFGDKQIDVNNQWQSNDVAARLLGIDVNNMDTSGRLGIVSDIFGKAAGGAAAETASEAAERIAKAGKPHSVGWGLYSW